MGLITLTIVFILGSLIYRFFFNETLNSKYQTAMQIEQQVQLKEGILAKLRAQKAQYNQMLDVTRKLRPNQESSYLMLGAVGQAVPGGVWFSVINFDQPNSLVIKGEAVNDQAIGSFIERLQALPMIEKSSLQNMSMGSSPQIASRNTRSAYKQFEIRCTVSTVPEVAISPSSPPPKLAPHAPAPSQPAQNI
jgi:type IV pilus assembly protein PilN